MGEKELKYTFKKLGIGCVSEKMLMKDGEWGRAFHH